MMYQQTHDTRTRINCCRAGFSLFEIVIVFAVIGAFLAFMIPQILQYQRSSKIKTAQNTLLQIKQAIVLYESDTGQFPGSLKDLVARPQDPEISSK